VEEIWKDIPDCSPYQASTLGRIRNKITGRVLKSAVFTAPGRHKHTDVRVGLHINKILKTYKVHRLCAKTFLDNYSDLLEVDHINGCSTDNRIENLRMVTHKENMNNPITLKYISERQKVRCTKYKSKNLK
jgi:hypothetical protein